MTPAAETSASQPDSPQIPGAVRDGSEKRPWRQTLKKRGVLFSFSGVTFGLLVTLAFHLSDFWHISLESWGWLVATNFLLHLALWLVPHLGWDERLRWDPDFLYIPWATVVVFFTASIYFMPDSRTLIPYGFLVNLLLLVGVAGFRQVLGFSLAMWGGYFGAIFLLVKQGAPMSLPYEASMAGLFVGVSLLAGIVLNRARQHRWELAGLRRRLTLAIRGSGAGWWDVAIDPARPTTIPDAVHFSPELKALLGFEDHEFPNSLKAWHSRVEGTAAHEALEAARRHLAGPSPLRETRYRIRHKNGELRQFYSHSSIQRNSEGLPVRWSGMEWDVTDRERDQEELHRLSRAVEQGSSLVIITDADGRIEYVNPSFCRTTGYSAAEVIGRNPRVLQSGDTSEEDYAAMYRSLRQGNEWHGEFRNLSKGGESYFVTSSISAIRNSAGKVTHFMAVQEDVTERRRVQAQLHQADRMETVGQLVSGVAHDFNNLLTVVIGFADLGLASVSAGDPLAEHLRQIRQAGESAGDLTRQLLAFGRQQILQFQVLDINESVSNVEKLLRRTIGEDLELVTDLAPDLWWIKVDPTSVEQLLVNLAVNARDAMPDGGRLTIVTSNVEIEEAEAEHPSVGSGAYVRLSVIDTGHGMDERTRSRIFEPFFTTKERGRGTGLGLSTVYGIVKQSGGHINVSPAPGRGSRFDVYLPRTQEEPAQETTAGRPAESKAGPESVLLVEDDKTVRDLVGRALDRQGYRVVQTACGSEALEAWQRNGEHFDLLLTDIVMPGMSGIELAETLSLEHSSLKVLLMSGYADQDVAGDQISGMVAPFLAKPFRVNELLRKVREVLEGAAWAA